MKIVMKVAESNHPNAYSWEEDCVVEEGDPKEKAQEIVDQFNSDRDAERVVLSAKKIDDSKQHDWQKKSLVTERGGYDIYRCTGCGALGKRQGLNDYVAPDKGTPKYCGEKKPFFKKSGPTDLSYLKNNLAIALERYRLAPSEARKKSIAKWRERLNEASKDSS